MQYLKKAGRFGIEERHPRFLVDVEIAGLEPKFFNAWHLEQPRQSIFEILDREDGDAREVNYSGYSLFGLRELSG